jgi:ubiquinone/menaquinone biosynthesis C-methylase UbiE
MNQKLRWEKEYSSDKGVPTTTRTTPSSSVVNAIKYLEEKRLLRGNTVIDLGCGTGRNALYLAKNGYRVTAVDFVDAALGKVNRKAKELDLHNMIKIKNTSIGKELPFEDNSFDLALDIATTMSLNPKQMGVFEKETRRIIKSNGLMVSYTLANDDEYMLEYGNKQAGTYFSPQSEIVEHCRSKEELKRIYSKWKFLKFKKIEKEDDYYGKRYLRRLWWIILMNRK